jgi:hypothetical protein
MLFRCMLTVTPGQTEPRTSTAISDIVQHLQNLIEEIASKIPPDPNQPNLYNNNLYVVADWSFLASAEAASNDEVGSLDVPVRPVSYFGMLIEHPGTHHYIADQLDRFIRAAETDFRDLHHLREQIAAVSWADAPLGYTAPVGASLAVVAPQPGHGKSPLIVAARRALKGVAINEATWSFPVDESVEHGRDPLLSLTNGLNQELGVPQKDLDRFVELDQINSNSWTHISSSADRGRPTGVTAIYPLMLSVDRLKRFAEQIKQGNPETGSSPKDIFVGTPQEFLDSNDADLVAQPLLEWVHDLTAAKQLRPRGERNSGLVNEPRIEQISILDEMNDAWYALLRHINEEVVNAKTDVEGASQSSAKALIVGAQAFAVRYERLRRSILRDEAQDFDTAREWETVVREIARRASTNQVLWDVVDEAYINYASLSGGISHETLASHSSMSVRDEDNDVYSSKRDGEILLYCVRLESRRGEQDLNRALNIFDLTENLDRFFGDSRVYFQTAVAINAFIERQASVHDRGLHRRGYALARSALMREAKHPGLNHVCALYNLQAARMEDDAAEKHRLLLQAKEYCWSAIQLNPSYHHFWATRARINGRLERPATAAADLDVAKDLLEKDHRMDNIERKRRMDVFHGIDDELRIIQGQSEQKKMMEQLGRQFNQGTYDLSLFVAETKRDMDAMKQKVEKAAFDLGETATKVLVDQKEVRHDMAAGRREQIQLVAIVAAFIGLIASSAPGVAAGLASSETVGELVLILLVPVVLVVALVITLRITFRGFDRPLRTRPRRRLRLVRVENE